MAGQFCGDRDSRQTWQGLRNDPKAVLVDVRTRAEWTYVGGPDLTDLGRPVIRVEWQSFPDGKRNPAFADEIAASGVTVDQPVYLICRSGVRSTAAAELLAGLGYTTYNVDNGFEGQLDPGGHRGTLNGWKLEGLPWRQG